jgi:hypothetical protein
MEVTMHPFYHYGLPESLCKWNSIIRKIPGGYYKDKVPTRDVIVDVIALRTTLKDTKVDV